MPAPYDYATTTGYARTRADWVDFPSTSTPITQAQLDQWDQAIRDMKVLVWNVLDYQADPTGAADSTTPIQNAINACNTAGGGIVYFPTGTYKFSALSLNGKANGVRLVGAGLNSTVLAWTSTTGTVIDMTNADFGGCENMLLKPNSAQKTAGELFLLTGSTQRTTFRNLRISSAFKGWNIGTATTTLITDIQMMDTNATWAWNSLIHLSGTATSTIINNIWGGTAANAGVGIRIDGAGVDTVQGSNIDLVGQSGGSFGGMLISAGEWMHFSNISIESGAGANGIEIGGTLKGITFSGVHLVSCFRGLVINGGKAITVERGEIVLNQREGVYLTASVAACKHLKILDLVVSDNGQATTNTYDGIYVTAGVHDFEIRGCTSDDASVQGTVPRVRYGCNIDASNARFTVTDNHFYGATRGLNSVATTDGNQVVKDNLPDHIPSVASATTTTLPGGPMVIVTGTTTITSVTIGHAGRMVTIQFAGILTFTDGGNLKLNGNFVTTADDTITLISDGTNWFEIARSVN